MPITYAQNGRYAVGRNQGRLVVDYPLVQPSTDVHFLIADMWAVFNGRLFDSTQTQAQGYKLSWLYGFGDDSNPTGNPTGLKNRHTKDIALSTTADQLVLNTSDRYFFPNSGELLEPNPDLVIFSDNVLDDRLSLARWRAPGCFDIGIIYHTAWNIARVPAPRPYYRSFVPESARLFSSVVVWEQSPTMFVKLANGQLTGVQGLMPGSNIVPTLDVQAQTAYATITAEAGSGTGQATDCGEAVPGIYTINKIPADAYGRFGVKANSCTAIDQPGYLPYLGSLDDTLADVPTNQLMLGNDCKQCCDCSDYESASSKLSAVYDRYANSGEQAEEIRKRYLAVLTRWEAAVKCATKPVTLVHQPQHSECPQIAFVSRVYNGTDKDWLNVTLLGEAVGTSDTSLIVVGNQTKWISNPSDGNYVIPCVSKRGYVDIHWRYVVLGPLGFTFNQQAGRQFKVTATLADGGVLSGDTTVSTYTTCSPKVGA